jgi:hypothetical protein
MKTTVNIHTFREEFNRMGRGNQFTYDGLEVLFDYLEELEHCEEEYELDVIGLCCDFAEGAAKDIARDYRIDLSALEGASEDEANFFGALTAIVREYLEDEGVLVGATDNTFVYRQF